MKKNIPAPPGAEMPDVPVAVEAEAPVIPKPISKKKIKVIANREGFIFNERKSPGSKFEVPSHLLGSWMDCEDPVEQEAHLKRLRAKKQAVNARSIADHEADIAADV